MDASDRFRTVVVEAVRSNALTASADDKEMIDQSFEQLGFDSLTLMEFCIAIAAETGVNLPVAQVVPLKTPAAVIRFLADGRGGSKLATPQAGPRDGLVARVLAGLATASSASDYYRIQIEMAQLATGPETATARTSAVRAPPTLVQDLDRTLNESAKVRPSLADFQRRRIDDSVFLYTNGNGADHLTVGFCGFIGLLSMPLAIVLQYFAEGFDLRIP